jgi:hypothetical protein
VLDINGIDERGRSLLVKDAVNNHRGWLSEDDIVAEESEA